MIIVGGAVQMPEDTETREQRFRRLADQRVNVILDRIRLLGQLANKSNYEYTDAQVEAIFKAIQKDINAAKSKFREGTKGRKRFTRISHIGSLQAQGAAQTRWQHHRQVLQGQSIAGLSNKRCVCSRRAPFLSVFIVLVSPASGVKPH